MDVLVIPDIHGRDKWRLPAQEFLAGSQGEVVFLGDYNDAYDVEDLPMLENFLDVLLLKLQFPDKVTLLLGNHCFPYLSAYFNCSGHRKSLWEPLHLLYTHEGPFQVAKQVGNTLFVHAGISGGWLRYNRQAIELTCGIELDAYLEHHSYADLLNLIYRLDRKLLWQVSKRHGGWDYHDSPLWVRPQDLTGDLLPGIHQVVGHTHMKEVAIHASPCGGSVTFTDCMGNADYTPYILTLP